MNERQQLADPISLVVRNTLSELGAEQPEYQTAVFIVKWEINDEGKPQARISFRWT